MYYYAICKIHGVICYKNRGIYVDRVYVFLSLRNGTFSSSEKNITCKTLVFLEGYIKVFFFIYLFTFFRLEGSYCIIFFSIFNYPKGTWSFCTTVFRCSDLIKKRLKKWRLSGKILGTEFSRLKKVACIIPLQGK